jgi:hypothetical protein
MTTFLKPLSRHWNPEDFILPEIILNDPVRHVAKTVCLLESRCDDYADYLRAVFSERDGAWKAAVDHWNEEECQHGELLRRMSESVDSTFHFEEFMSRYQSLVSYHEPTGTSVRGSVGAELVSRCVVEALASTLYRVLADHCESPECKKVFSALAQDEARHFGMFLKMLNEECSASGRLGFFARSYHAVRRMMDLEDGQIMTASFIVGRRGTSPMHLQREANWYLGRLYALYRWKHLRYAARMLIQAVRLKPNRVLTLLATSVLWLGIALRGAWARLPTRWAPEGSEHQSPQGEPV